MAIISTVNAILLFVFLWMTSAQRQDRLFTRTTSMMDAKNPQNCGQGGNLQLPMNTVSNLPRYRGDASHRQSPNGVSMQYAFNTAANRAIFLSLLYRWTSNYTEWMAQPGLQYFYLSTAANTQAGPSGVASSGLFFGHNTTYPNWLFTMPFNTTFPLFAVRSSLSDDQGNHVDVKDLGSTEDTNYTNRQHYPQGSFFEPYNDNNGPHRLRTMTMKLHRAGGSPTNITFSLRKMTGNQIAQVVQPYYDCRQTNKWLVSAVSIAGEPLARYTMWRNLVHYKNIALSTVDVEFDAIDVDACPFTSGSQGHRNAFNGMASCPDNQECQVTPGSGFVRDGYTCCQSNTCSDTSPSADFIAEAQAEMDASRSNAECVGLSSELVLNSRFWSQDANKAMFQVQGRAAHRLALFLSAYLQLSNPDQATENFQFWQQAWSTHRLGHPEPQPDTPLRYTNGDHALTLKQLLAEVFSMVVSDGDILSAGVFLEQGYVHNNTNPVGAFAWRDATANGVEDPGFETQANAGDLYELGEHFNNDWEWYRQAGNNYAFLPYSDLTEYGVSEEIRVVIQNRRRGYQSTVHDLPGTLSYFAKDYEAGTWLAPHFPCDDARQTGWRVSYVAPIFAKGEDSYGPRFAGVVKVDARFSTNHIHQES